MRDKSYARSAAVHTVKTSWMNVEEGEEYRNKMENDWFWPSRVSSAG